MKTLRYGVLIWLLLFIAGMSIGLSFSNKRQARLLQKVYKSNEHIKQDNAMVLETLKKYRLELGEVGH